MTDSLPSKKFANIDIPDVTEFTADFVYNFFTKDERVNGSGLDAPESISKRSAENFDSQLIDSVNFRRFVPRFVKLNWGIQADRNNIRILNTPSVKENLEKIHNEQTFTTDEFTSMFFQDNGQDRKVEFLIRRILEETRRRQTSEENESPLDIVKYLKTRSDVRVGPRFLSEAFSQLENDGVIFLDKNNRKITENNIIKETSDVKSRIQINNKILYKTLKTANNSTLNLFNDEVSSQLRRAKEIQEKAISQKNSSIFDGLDYDFEILDYVGIRSINPTTFDSTTQIIGYIVDKKEISPEGEIFEHEPIIIENPFANTAVDLKIKYGSTYVYQIRSVALIELPVEDANTNDIVALSFVVSSQPSKRSVMVTEESVPPPPPADFNINYDYQNDALRLMWNFPVNTQRDIKYFQVFRRESIDQPFELIKQYDFDDSVAKSDFREFPDEQLIEIVDSPKNFYLDREFTKDSSYIYSICAIDAHGYSSNYSIQFRITFDRYRNKIVKETVSLSGAPKAYPNAFLLQDVFVDTIRDSGHDKVKVVFTPEFLNVLNNNGDDLRLIKADNNSKYKLQLINIDLQEQQTIDIGIKDRRTTTEKNEDE